MSQALSSPPLFSWRYGMFLALLASIAPLARFLPWHEATMAGFDIAALAFIASSVRLVRGDANSIRRYARDNDANRGLMLLITAIVSLVVLVAVGVAVSQHQGRDVATIALLLSTLLIAWFFSNLVYAMHYAHIFYRAYDDSGRDSGGLDFPDTHEPRYWDFLYFAYTLGMTFQTSDISINNMAVRKTVLFHCLAAFVFNLGIMAFTINVLGGN